MRRVDRTSRLANFAIRFTAKPNHHKCDSKWYGAFRHRSACILPFSPNPLSLRSSFSIRRPRHKRLTAFSKCSYSAVSALMSRPGVSRRDVNRHSPPPSPNSIFRSQTMRAYNQEWFCLVLGGSSAFSCPPGCWYSPITKLKPLN